MLLRLLKNTFAAIGLRDAKGLYGVIGGTGVVAMTLLSMTVFLSEEVKVEASSVDSEFRATTWEMVEPAVNGLNEAALDQLAQLVGGAGFVAHRGKGVFRWGYDHRPRYAASAKKSIISALNLQAVEQGLLSGVDERVVQFEPRLASLNGGKDAQMTWRHLGCMTSGYGATDAPGEAFAYSDFAVALWYDTLMDKVYREKGTAVLQRQLATPLGFEDPVTFQAFGPEGPEPKLRISARDLARFGQLILDNGMWQGKRILSEASMATLLGSVVPVTLPISAGKSAEMLPGQKTVGGQMWNISPIGPGRYSFHIWMNRRGPTQLMMLPDAPGDTMLASGKWGQTVLWIIPSLELVVAWNDSAIDDHHLAREDSEAEMNVAARLMVQAVTQQPPQNSVK
jgi:CubicO group peptidase (beta-lactamase class C family)